MFFYVCTTQSHLSFVQSYTHSSYTLLEKQNIQQYGAVWTTDDHLPIVSSLVVSLGVSLRV